MVTFKQYVIDYSYLVCKDCDVQGNCDTEVNQTGNCIDLIKDYNLNYAGVDNE